MADFPDGLFSRLAAQQLEEAKGWQVAIDSSDSWIDAIVALRLYLDRFSKGCHAADAKKSLRARRLKIWQDEVVRLLRERALAGPMRGPLKRTRTKLEYLGLRFQTAYGAKLPIYPIRLHTDRPDAYFVTKQGIVKVGQGPQNVEIIDHNLVDDERIGYWWWDTQLSKFRRVGVEPGPKSPRHLYLEEVDVSFDVPLLVLPDGYLLFFHCMIARPNNGTTRYSRLFPEHIQPADFEGDSPWVSYVISKALWEKGISEPTYWTEFTVRVGRASLAEIEDMGRAAEDAVPSLISQLREDAHTLETPRLQLGARRLNAKARMSDTIDALGKIGAGAVPLLVEMAEGDESDGARDAARKALIKIGSCEGGAIEYVEEEYSKSRRERRKKGRTGDPPEIRDLLRMAINDPSCFVNRPHLLGALRGSEYFRSRGYGATRDDPLNNVVVSQMAPDFAIETLSGESITLASLAGQRIVLWFDDDSSEVAKYSDLVATSAGFGMTIILALRQPEASHTLVEGTYTATGRAAGRLFSQYGIDVTPAAIVVGPKQRILLTIYTGGRQRSIGRGATGSSYTTALADALFATTIPIERLFRMGISDYYDRFLSLYGKPDLVRGHELVRSGELVYALNGSLMHIYVDRDNDYWISLSGEFPQYICGITSGMEGSSARKLLERFTSKVFERAEFPEDYPPPWSGKSVLSVRVPGHGLQYSFYSDNEEFDDGHITGIDIYPSGEYIPPLVPPDLTRTLENGS